MRRAGGPMRRFVLLTLGAAALGLIAAGIVPAQDRSLLAVGVGAPGALALQQKKVDALALWDTLQASLENRGLALRRLDLPMIQDMIGQTLATSDGFLAEHPDVLVGFVRGIA